MVPHFQWRRSTVLGPPQLRTQPFIPAVHQLQLVCSTLAARPSDRNNPQPRPSAARPNPHSDCCTAGCAAHRDFVPWRFSDADRISVWSDRHCRRPKTCTIPDHRTAKEENGGIGLRRLSAARLVNCLLALFEVTHAASEVSSLRNEAHLLE